MGKVFTHMTMSLDGFIADPNDDPGELFEWYGAGDTEVASDNPDVTFKVDKASAEVLNDLTESVGVIVAGRRLFDIASGWGDHHPAGARVVVVTHDVPDNADEFPRTTFVADVETAIAKAKETAGDQNVTIASADIAQQALDLKLVDEVVVTLAPVLFGEGIPYFGELKNGHLMLEDPVVVEGKRALHLRYPVRR